MKSSFIVIIITVFLTLCIPAYGVQDVDDILSAIVKLRSFVPENARTARLLGTEREGTGVVIDSDGLILTIGYLILEASHIVVFGPEGKTLNAKYIGYDHDTGFGLVRAAKPLNVKPMTLGLSSDIKDKSPLLVASHGGRDSIIGVRVISRQEYVGYWEYILEDAIFTIPPHPRYGGAALIDQNGRLVGIGSLSSQFQFPGVGSVLSNMFIPIDRLKPILADMISTGRSSQQPRPWLGVYSEEIYGRVIVFRVGPGGPADQAGLHYGDIILKVENDAIHGLADFYRKIWALGNVGVEIHLSILQGAQIKQLTIRTEDRYQYFKLNPRK
jgi:S1-C subfamily serine protease